MEQNRAQALQLHLDELAGKPLTTYRTVVELIAATTTRTGLKVEADLDTGFYPTGVKVSDAELRALPLQPHEWHSDWNYTVLPR